MNVVALTAENIEVDPEIWTRIDNGDYQIIFASPEILFNASSHFRRKTLPGSNVFKERLALVCVDEAHCIWVNGDFRPEYNDLGQLREYMPLVPFLAMSATMPAHIMATIQKVLMMPLPSDLIICPGRKKNLDILVREQHTRKDLSQLHWLIPSGARSIHDIPKTLVFADSVPTVLKIMEHLRNVFHLQFPDSKPIQAIQPYYSSIDAKRKQETRDEFESGSARIVITTDSMSLGIDIRDIARVIQWGVDEKLDLNTLWQRFGRAARDPEIQGLGVVYVSRDLVDAVRKYEMEDWKKGIGRNVRKEMMGGLGNVNSSDNEESDDDDGIIPKFRHRILEFFSLPVTQETGKEVQGFRAHMYRQAEDESKIRKEAQEERQMKMRGPKSDSKEPKTRRQSIELIEPALLWFINTVGCRHRCILSYLKYPDVFDDAAQKSWCCDNCALVKGSEIHRELATAGMGPSDSIFAPRNNLPESVPKPSLAQISNCPPSRSVNVKAAVPQLQTELRLWRGMLHRKFIDRKILFAGCPSAIVMPNKVIDRIAKDIRNILGISQLKQSLARANYDWENGVLRDKDFADLLNIFDTIAKVHLSAHLPAQTALTQRATTARTNVQPPLKPSNSPLEGHVPTIAYLAPAPTPTLNLPANSLQSHQTTQDGGAQPTAQPSIHRSTTNEANSDDSSSRASKGTAREVRVVRKDDTYCPIDETANKENHCPKAVHDKIPQVVKRKRNAEPRAIADLTNIARATTNKRRIQTPRTFPE